MAAHHFDQDDLKFSPPPKMQGERNPDSVLFNIRDLDAMADAEATGQPEASSVEAATAEPATAEPATAEPATAEPATAEPATAPKIRAVPEQPPSPEQDAAVAESKERANSSGLIDVNTLLDEEKRAQAKDALSSPINPGLIRPEDVSTPVAAAPKVPLLLLVGVGLAVLVAAGAVFTAAG